MTHQRNAERLTRQRNRALIALHAPTVQPRDRIWFRPAGAIYHDQLLHRTLMAEVDHETTSSEVTKRQAADHHPKSEPSFFESASSADTSAVRSSLSPAQVCDECGGLVYRDGCPRHGGDR